MNQKNESGKKEPNRRLFIILAVIFGIALLVCLFLMGKDHLNRRQAEENFDKLSEQTVEPVETDGTEENDILSELGIEVPEKHLDWDAIREENADIYAWIYIPGTQVDYPVLQHPTEDDYYLDRNLDGSSGYPGCIYTQTINGKEFRDPNTVLYGHNMGNGTMFGSLHDYADNTFFEEHPYVYIYTPDGEVLVYEIFAASTFTDDHLLYNYDYSTEDGFSDYVSKITGVRDMNSHVRSDISVEYGDFILTLSTCIKNHPTERWLVSAVLLNK